MNHDIPTPHNSPEGDPGGDREPDRSQGGGDIPPSPGASSASTPGNDTERNPIEGIDVDELRSNPVLLAQITASLQENHLHLPLLTPEISEMVKMREQTPELYDSYVNAINQAVEADRISRTHPYTQPPQVAARGQRNGLIAVIAVLVFCGFLAWLDHIWAASIIGAIDIVALAAVFAGDGQQSGD